MSVLNTSEAIRRILSENPPLYFSELNEKYRELAGPLAVGSRSVRRSLDQLISMKLVIRGNNYTAGKGYTYATPATNGAPVATPTEIVYGDQVVEAVVLLATLWKANKHPVICDENWEDFRIYVLQFLLGASDSNTFKEWLVGYRDKLARHLTQVNTLINGDLYHPNKRKAIVDSIPNNELILDYLNQYTMKQITELPEV